ncbi:MAG: hypothetical protein QOK88_00960 [Nitrososphaeraceae archaeon]|jgi:hypothetical protein|nr:hypothetical protein [Nitrososphaeraceae archaeon]
MDNRKFLERISGLQTVCKIISQIKSQLIEMLPHYGHDALFFQNDEITTGLLNNKTEVKIHLLTGELLYFHNEIGHFVDLTRDGFYERLESIVTKYGLNMPKVPSLTLRQECLFEYITFAKRVNKSLELFRMKLRDHFTQVHLWPHGFDFSVESFINGDKDQIGVGVSPGDDSYEAPYLYVNPYPFSENIIHQPLPIGKWHTQGWNGIKVEWNDLNIKKEQEVSTYIYTLYQVAMYNF